MAMTDEVAGLKQNFVGKILVPDQQGYDEARVLFNSMIDTRPGVIAQCASNDDVAAAIAFGRNMGLEIAVRGGGHSVAGMSSTEGGLVIDLRKMNSVTVDPEARMVKVGGGATMSHLDRGTQPFDLAVTGGRVSTTGVGGFTLGGGSGWLERKHGMTMDNLLAVELVTADGQHIRATEDDHPELFWGLHGGGGNFGVATSFELALHPLPAISAGLMVWKREDSEKVVRRFRDIMEDAPDEASGGLMYLAGPEDPMIPEPLIGKLILLVVVTYAGPEEEFRKLVKPLMELKPEAEMAAEMPYAELQCMIDDPPGHRNYWSAEHLNTFPDDAVDRFCSLADGLPTPSLSQHVLFVSGGAMARGVSAGYPVASRGATWVAHPFAVWEDPSQDAEHKEWTRKVRAEMRPWATGDVYLNFVGNEGEDRVLAGFGKDNYSRLAKIKREYDPENIFRLNHNIKPNGS